MENENMQISMREGYEVMIHMLNSFYELTGSKDITDILSGGEYIGDGEPADAVFWEYWLEAREKLVEQGPLMKKWIKW